MFVGFRIWRSNKFDTCVFHLQYIFLAVEIGRMLDVDGHITFTGGL